ncbi:MAG: exodeoxyribonuclease VII small subunit [Clostridia bacterium]|nr:exodeoxyribonuclease VII small subunit [Clostridia bacterium]
MPAKKTEKANADFSYEEGIAQLEALVEGMEEGALSLEETLAAYERGVALHGRLEALLKRGERRIEMLAPQGEEAGETSAKRIPFESEPEHIAFALEEE